MRGRNDPIYYAAVAGDVLGTYLRWRSGQSDERQTALTYSGQFFELCKRLGRAGIASFPSAEKKKIIDAAFDVHSRPFGRFGNGIGFYVNHVCRAVWLLIDVARSRASDVIVMDGVTFYFLLLPLSWFGRRVFLSIHTVIGSQGANQGFLQRTTARLDAWFIRRHCAGCLVASPRIAAHLCLLTGCQTESVSLFYPTYDHAAFASFLPPDPTMRPFRLLYAGRIEVEKGVFDLLEIYRRLLISGKNLQLDYCGDGGALQPLRDAISESGLSSSVKTHGHLNQSELLTLMAKAHVVVVPTRSSFPEGLNQVVIEAVLAKRPVVTSSVCPAMDLVADAVVEAEPDRVESYTAAIRRLIDDPELFKKKVEAASRLGAEFFDSDKGWTARATKLFIEHSPKLQTKT
jgi:glycogen synthase